MNAMLAIYNKLEETYGAGQTIRALAACGGVGLILLALFLKPQQPVIIINEPLKIEDNK